MSTEPNELPPFPPELQTYRVSLYVDNDMVFGASVKTKPQNHKEMVELLRHIIECMESPEVSDSELLGKYSPKEL